MEQKTNALQMPTVFYCRHMYSGLAGYESETILVDLDAMQNLAPSMAGKPVYVFHQDVDVGKIEEADGFVSDCWYNPDDGWLWAKFIAVTDTAQEAIRNGWSVSNAYIPEDGGSAGTYTNIEYDRKLSGGEFTHLAIVPNPRYELAQIFNKEQYDVYRKKLENNKQELINAKEKPPMAFNIFKSKKEGIEGFDSLSEILVNHKSRDTEVSVEQLLNESADFDQLQASLNNGTYEVKVNGESMAISDLINKYTNMCEEKANAESEDEKENTSDEDDEKENESDEDEKENMSDEDEKKNSKFNELKNASNNSARKDTGYVSMQERLDVGKKRF